MWLFGPLCKREVSGLGLLPQKFVNISIEITRYTMQYDNALHDSLAMMGFNFSKNS